MNEQQQIEFVKKFYKRYGSSEGNLDDLAYSLTRWKGWSFEKAIKALQIVRKSEVSEGIENLFGPPASQAFADTGNNPHIDHTKLGKPFNEKSDTGDDKTRTGPGGNQPRENYDLIHYQGTKDSKIHLATPYYDGKEIHDVSGTIPELELKKPKQELELETVDDTPGVFAQKEQQSIVLSEGRLIAKKYLKFKYNSGKTECPICKPLDGMEFADDDPKRPILPSEKMGEGVYNTHPNCLCTFEAITKYEDISLEADSDSPQSRAAASSLKERHDITNEYLRPLQESLNIFKDKQPGEFDWINETAIENMKDFTKEHPDGRFILAVVSGESYTDHRIEGEKLRRHWTNKELMQNIRTAKRKLTDINHMWQKKDPLSGLIYDANWNFTTNKGEMIIWESDPEILDAIRKDIITAVSINTGKPREVEENCSTGECLSEPKGTVLGEDNNVALAFIITDPDGWDYNGQHIPAMPPGMKFTKIFIIE